MTRRKPNPELARETLEAAGAAGAWAIFVAKEAEREAHRVAWADWRDANGAGPEPVRPAMTDAEATVVDIVTKLVKWGNITDKAMNFVKVLVERIKNAPALAAAREAEAAAAKPVPVFAGRVKIEGEVLTTKFKETRFGTTLKMLVRVTDGGFKLWGTVPASLKGDGENVVKRGDRVEFEATVTVSDNDPKFGFFNRPTMGRVIEPAKTEEAA